ncbi:MAG TPA: VOC family protein [Candidatus Eisenbacteria bacterium]|nr:MAG: VOC family protein [Deltaproteobacteria bacterium]HSR22970.1 VOC family protein [Candidatus Eisenbacteria bacterium]
MITRIDHLNIVVSDLEEARAFFLLLGFTEGLGADLDPAFLQRLTGIAGASGRFVTMRHAGSNTTIELLRFDASGGADPQLGRADRIGLRHLAFAVADIDAVVARLQAAGTTFLSPVQTWEKTGKRLVYLLGPDGILLELAEYPDERHP